MQSPLAFFSFVSLSGGNEKTHREYNEWHQLDHRPENLALPGVAWGDRWARRGSGATGSSEFMDTDYVAMYWFKDPVSESVKEWDHLGADSLQWGRGPLIPGVERRLLAFFRPIKGYVAASALVSTAALPYRPNRGIHLTLRRFPDPLGSDTHAHHQWEDRVLMPRLLDIDGVAGGWTFSFSHYQQHSSLPFSSATTEPAGSLRISMLYLDGGVQQTREQIEEVSAEESAPDVEVDVLFRSQLATIVPWADW